MQAHNHFQLKPYNTFSISAIAKFFASFSSMEELQEVLESKEASGAVMILGGGSNILFTHDYNGLIIKNEIPGIMVSAQDNDFTYVTAGAGESWDELVSFCVNRDLSGIENLSLIPGNCGAAPMQNIGAYGVELADVFYELRAYHIAEKKIVVFNKNACAFGYRESVFKKELKGEFVIIDITLKLNKRPVYNISYDALKKELEKLNNSELSVKLISDTVSNIRRTKLPDPKVIGNAGSFFKNPVVSDEVHDQLRSSFPNIISYASGEGCYKLAAAWLIEQCGYKGFKRGDAGCHKDQALVIVNYGEASGEQIYALSEEILNAVVKKFGVVLEREVNIV